MKWPIKRVELGILIIEAQLFVTLKKNPYTGLIKCADCGSPMFAVGGPNYKYRAGYNCGNYLKNGINGGESKRSKQRKIDYNNLGCNGSHYIAEEELDKLVKNYIRKVKISLTDTLAKMDIAKSKLTAEKYSLSAKKLKDKQDELKAEIKLNERQRVRQILKDESKEEEINKIFDDLNEDIAQEIEALENKIAFLSEQSSKRKEIKESYQEIISRFDALLEKESFEKTDLNRIIKEITVDSDRVVTIRLYSDITDLFDIAR